MRSLTSLPPWCGPPWMSWKTPAGSPAGGRLPPTIRWAGRRQFRRLHDHRTSSRQRARGLVRGHRAGVFHGTKHTAGLPWLARYLDRGAAVATVNSPRSTPPRNCAAANMNAPGMICVSSDVSPITTPVSVDSLCAASATQPLRARRPWLQARSPGRRLTCASPLTRSVHPRGCRQCGLDPVRARSPLSRTPRPCSGTRATRRAVRSERPHAP